MPDLVEAYDLPQTPSAAEHARLTRLCAQLSGDLGAAEDLAQETLLIAWRLRGQLTASRDPEGRARWLAAIARNVCMRWRRSLSQERARRAAPIHLDCGDPSSDSGVSSLEDVLADTTDLELGIERDELAELLDRALALLSPIARDVLIARFIHEKPQAEIAARLGVSEDVVAQRLHRGKITLRRLLTTDLRREAAPYLVFAPTADTSAPAWQETRIWCPFCGRHRLLSYSDRATGAFCMHCAGNCLAEIHIVGMANVPELVGTLTSPKALLTRICLTLSASYRRHIAERGGICPCCGGQMEVRLGIPSGMYVSTVAETLLTHGVYTRCSRCDMLSDATSHHLTIDTPQAIAFWRRHPRMRPLPAREIEYGGRPALLTGFESVEDSARLEIISARDTWETLHAEEGGSR